MNLQHLGKFLCIALLFLCFAMQAQRGAFIENKGQWAEDFDYKLPSAYGGVFLDGHSVTFNLGRPLAFRSKTEEEHVHSPAHDSLVQYHAYRMTFLGGNPSASGRGEKKRREYLNYLLGRDRSRWKGHVGLYEEVVYEDIYPGIDIQYYFNEDGNLKYDLVVAPGSDPGQVVLQYEGQESLHLVYGNLMVHTTVEDVLESAPYAYQEIEGGKREVPCSYRLEDNRVYFELGDYDCNLPLVIDPVLIFSTFTGSLNDNWGFTATYGKDGTLYGGGIVFGNGSGYPVTTGAFQDTSNGGTQDIGISKFSADGSTLVYSTYLGGERNELPHSILEGENKELIILGNTDSKNFPVTSNAHDTILNDVNKVFNTLNIGGRMAFTSSDIFIAKLDSTGSHLVSSTYVGGTNFDGINKGMYKNYGDESRGDIAVDSSGNIYAVSHTYSQDFPVAGNVTFPSKADNVFMDGVVFSLDPSLSNLRWSSFFGGSQHDALFSLKLVDDTSLYVTGATRSPDMNVPDFGGYRRQPIGAEDGIIARIDPAEGNVQSFTYNGTPGSDVNFFIDYDFDGDIYVFGQTNGEYPVIGQNTYTNPNSAQFIQKFDHFLTGSSRSMTFGNGIRSIANISPTGLMVDNCKNIYVSGWGGSNNPSQGWVYNMPVTPNAYKKNTDSSDFYFLILDASWEKVNYGTYFGEQGNGDHVDGGTSRFRKDGTIYQAVCAGCGGSDNFPTTAGAFSQNNGSGNCNLAVFKFQMESNVVIASVRASEDSACVPYTSNILNESYNADIILVESPAGVRDTLKGQITISNTGHQAYTFIAIDTTCGFRDSTQLVFFGYTDSLEADFTIDYDSCQSNREVSFVNRSRDAVEYFWDFGDGQTSADTHPLHEFEEGENTYLITLVAINRDCGVQDTVQQELKFKSRTGQGDFTVEYHPCESNKAAFTASGTGFGEYIWYIDGKEEGEGYNFQYEFNQPGMHTVSLQSIDSACQRFYTRQQSFEVFDAGFQMRMPNVFTPNGDGENDTFGFLGEVSPNFFTGFDFRVYNRWGTELFHTAGPELKWNGSQDGNELPQGVYYYLVSYEDHCGNTGEIKGFVHLFR